MTGAEQAARSERAGSEAGPASNGSLPDPSQNGVDPRADERGVGSPSGFMATVEAIDERVDAWFDVIRGNPTFDGAAKVITGLGDHGLMWAATTVWRARRSGPDRARAVRALAISGVESSLVNAGLKAVIGRSRPDQAGLRLTEGGVPVRQPKTSSFPSGHTLAAFCSATVMHQPGDRAGSTLLFTSATLVGVSRIHLGAHHASDVVGGAVIGAVLGLIGRRLL
jgi:membrane-associated phospholipid phosphatase